MHGAQFLDSVRNPLIGLLLDYALASKLLSRDQIISQTDLRAVVRLCLDGLQKKVDDIEHRQMKFDFVHQRRLLAVVLEMLNTYAHDHSKETQIVARCVAGTLGAFIMTVKDLKSRSAVKLDEMIEEFFRGDRADASSTSRESLRDSLIRIRQSIESAVYAAGKDMTEPQHLLQLAYLDKLLSDAPASLAELAAWAKQIASYKKSAHAKWIDRQVERWGTEIIAVVRDGTSK